MPVLTLASPLHRHSSGAGVTKMNDLPASASTLPVEEVGTYLFGRSVPAFLKSLSNSSNLNVASAAFMAVPRAPRAPISISKNYTRWMNDFQHRPPASSSTAAAACCVARGVADELNNVVEGGSNSAAPPSNFHAELPRGGAQIGASIGISAIALGGMWASHKVQADYREKQNALELAEFLTDAMKNWVNEENPERAKSQMLNIKALKIHLGRMKNKARVEKWIAGRAPMVSLGLMGLSQIVSALMPPALASGVLIDALQIAKLAKETHDEKHLLKLIDLDEKYTRQVLINLEQQHKLPNIDQMTELAAAQKKIVPVLKKHLEALKIQKHYFEKKGKERLISSTGWTAQMLGTAGLLTASLAMMGLVAFDPTKVLAISLAAIVLGVGANLKYNTRLTSTERYAPVLMKKEFGKIIYTNNRVKDGKIIEAFPESLASREEVDAELIAAQKKKNIVKDYTDFFSKHQSVKDKILYQAWRNANRTFLLFTLGLAPDTLSASKLRAKKFITRHFNATHLNNEAIWQKRLDVLAALGRINLVDSANEDPGEQPLLASERRMPADMIGRLEQLLDAIENTPQVKGAIGKLIAKRALDLQIDRSKAQSLRHHPSIVPGKWSWDFSFKKPWASLKHDSARYKTPAEMKEQGFKENQVWQKNWKDILKGKPPLYREASYEFKKPGFKRLLDIDQKQHDEKALLSEMYPLGPCCDADFFMGELIESIKIHYCDRAKSEKESDNEKTNRDDILQLLLQDVDRCLAFQLPKDARRELSTSAEYLAGFQLARECAPSLEPAMS
jgi:hypothetical protein